MAFGTLVFLSCHQASSLIISLLSIQPGEQNVKLQELKKREAAMDGE